MVIEDPKILLEIKEHWNSSFRKSQNWKFSLSTKCRVVIKCCAVIMPWTPPYSPVPKKSRNIILYFSQIRILSVFCHHIALTYDILTQLDIKEYWNSLIKKSQNLKNFSKYKMSCCDKMLCCDNAANPSWLSCAQKSGNNFL